jgi:hypothetical protein
VTWRNVIVVGPGLNGLPIALGLVVRGNAVAVARTTASGAGCNSGIALGRRLTLVYLDAAELAGVPVQ